MARSKISLQDLMERFKLSKDQLNTSLGEEQLKEVSRIVADPGILGPELGLTPDEMTAISSEKAQLQGSAVLTKWKQKSAWKANYHTLIEALLKCTRADLAQKVCELLAQKVSSEQPQSASAGHSTALRTSPLSHRGAIGTDGTQHDGEQWAASILCTPPQHPPGDGNQFEMSPSYTSPAHSNPREEQLPGMIVNAPVVSQPDLCQVEEGKRLQQEVKRLERKFEDLLNATCDDLKKRKVPIPQIRRSLFVRRASDTQTDVDLVAGHRHEIREADAVDDLFDILSAGKCWDFLNPGLLKRIIDGHCTESADIQHQKTEYLEHLQQFRKRTNALLFAKICNVSDLNPKFSEVVFEMDKDWDSATLEDVENLKQKIRGVGYLEDQLFNFKRSKNSSLSLVWAFPRSCPVSTTILRIPPSFYLEHGIRRVRVKGVCVVDVSFEEEQEEVVAKQPDIRLQLQKRLQQKEKEVASVREMTEVMASLEKFHRKKLNETEKSLKAAIKSNEQLTAALDKAKSVQRTPQKRKFNLESRLKEREPQMPGLTGRIVSAPHLHAMEQEILLKKKDEKETADYGTKITLLKRNVETLKELSKKSKGSEKEDTFSEAMRKHRDALLKQHKNEERELLQELKRMKEVKGRHPPLWTGDDYVESRGIRYSMKQGGTGGNRGEVMILVSVGSVSPAGVQVQSRVRNPALTKKAIQTHGHLPPIVTGLHEEAAADLMARASLQLQSPNADLLRLCLDVPGRERSKEYYLNIIEKFLKRCQQPGAVLYYLGHSEEGTGNWCFKDGTISFQEIFDIYRRCCPGKTLDIHTDCCYSGNWVRECAKTLDSLGIPPCGHRAREQGILVKVFASCQPDQEAAEPCYSVEGVTVKNNGTLTFWAKQLSQQISLYCDTTGLTCCRGPDELCRSEEGLKNWTWQDAIDHGLLDRVFIIRGKDRNRPTWHYVLLSSKSEAYKEKFLEQVKSGRININEWGYRIEAGWGEDPPEDLQKKITNWMWV